MANPIGSAPGLLVGAAIGAAAGAAFEPAFEVPRQDAWHNNPNRILGVGILASLVAQGGVLLGNADGSTSGSAYNEALRQGYTSDKLNRLIYLAQTAPDLALTLELWRRGLFGTPTSKAAVDLVEHAFAKHQIEPQYWPALEELFSGRLDPALIATMVQRSVLPNATDPGGGGKLLPFNTADIAQTVYDDWHALTQALTGTTPATGHNVTPMPQVDLDPITEARAHGIDFDRLAAETRIVGLPASPDLAARAVYRGIITAADFVQAMAEGNARVEWAPALFEAFREIPTVRDFVQGHLRGWRTKTQMYAGAQRHGMGPNDTDLLFQIERRPLTVHHIAQALAWGGQFNPAPDELQDPYDASVHQADLGPEWYDLQKALKYSYSVPFWWRSMTQSGSLGAGEAETILLRLGNPPGFAASATQHFSGGTTAATDKDIASAQTKLKTRTHASYIAHEISDATATTALGAAGVNAAAAPAVLTLWQHERDLIRKQLSAQQIKKEWYEQVTDPATGAPLTQQQAVARLMELGYDQADAQTLLEL